MWVSGGNQTGPKRRSVQSVSALLYLAYLALSPPFLPIHSFQRLVPSARVEANRIRGGCTPSELGNVREIVRLGEAKNYTSIDSGLFLIFGHQHILGIARTFSYLRTSRPKPL